MLTWISFVPLVLGMASGFVSRQGPYWEAQRLRNIPCQPPGVWFSVVWPLLYLMMGQALALVVKQVAWSHPAVVWFGIQMILNVVWAPLNTYINHPSLMLFMTAGTLATATYATVLMSRVSATAGLWMVPYLLWLTFATALSRNRVVVERGRYP